GVFIQLSDLRRFLRLFGDRDRAGAVVRLPPADQLQPSLHRNLVLGVLDALAHVAVELAPHLSLYPARRQPAGACQDLSQLDHRDGTRRSLAWSRPELSLVGSPAWQLPGAGAAALAVSSVDRLDLVPRGADRRGFSVREHALDFLQAAQFRSRLE